MTEVAFHFNVPDKLAYACRLLRKAWLTKAQVAVTGQAQALAQMDQLLWTFSATDFVPHCSIDAAPDLLGATPIVLTPKLALAPVHQVALNLGDEVPTDFERYERLIEIVSTDADDRQRARLRWKHYADRGYAMTRHDLASKAADHAHVAA